MDFKQIEAFINVAKFKSFSKAAEAIFLSQPTISAHISNLEKELNTTLFDRSSKEVNLTPAGKIFFDYALNLLNIRNNAIYSINEFQKNITGKLNIASSTTPCRFLLPSLVKKFTENYPSVDFDVKEDSTKNVIGLVLNGDVELGIVGETICDERLEYKKIADDNLILISSPDVPSINSIEDMIKEKFILRESGSATRNVFEEFLSSNGLLEKIKVAIETSSLEAVLQFVKNGLGVSVVSELACEDYIKAGYIKKHDVKNLDLKRNIYLVLHQKRTLSPAARAFKEFISNI
ncbi:selenium metabolism-associated LysR family transcriptional regulator [Caloramator sp. CAR-1]|uniref:selenium metabolism-associated LysR family transcriptional regulator n=1 Tax=Caloramator sp. CAR-1 TaxID=3062777 RepID=UPI0026E3140B|nr:selenium metabolism-associated LysR family transcriptional regulator [Caloramator sp. CAR-1]MDO6354913.1 selenium metabolism-associated LysR family transcriptional regulator [Caloramator sp. CAR-1]